MKCSIHACSGDYVSKRVNQSFNCDGHLVVVDGISALACDVCKDIIFTAATTKALEVLLESTTKPNGHVPLYWFG
jgi:YgiT-type zinc finger domain-containing protein